MLCIHAVGGEKIKAINLSKLFGESMLYSACEPGLRNEIHEPVDLNFVI